MRKTTLIFTLLFWQVAAICQNNNAQKTKHTNSCFINEQTTKACTCKIAINLEDSNTLKHIKYDFYINNLGHIFNITSKFNESTKTKPAYLSGYFNGCIPQFIDVFSFEYIDGFYAKDTNNVYYNQGTSGGTVFIVLENVHVKSFKVLNQHYAYGVDKNNYYEMGSIIKGFPVNKNKVIKNAKGRIITLLCNKKKYKLNIVGEN
jgi:hypothetical protein